MSFYQFGACQEQYSLTLTARIISCFQQGYACKWLPSILRAGSTSALPTEICPTPCSGLIRCALSNLRLECHVGNSHLYLPFDFSSNPLVLLTIYSAIPYIRLIQAYDGSGNLKVTSSNAKPLTPKEEFLLPNANAMSGRGRLPAPAEPQPTVLDIEESLLTAKPEPGPRRN